MGCSGIYRNRGHRKAYAGPTDQSFFDILVDRESEEKLLFYIERQYEFYGNDMTTTVWNLATELWMVLKRIIPL